VSLACPWAHRTLIVRALKGLEQIVPVSVTHWLMAEHGWTFAQGEGVIPDPLFNSRYLHELYTRADPNYTGHASVPVLWDKHTQTIVNNESSEIIRMFNTAFNAVGAGPGDFYPRDKREEIDAVNARVYDTLNNGVYKSGFATTQTAYEEAVVPLFDTLDWLEERLGQSRFLIGDNLTEADIRLFTTLVRFDVVYNGHFKCNIRRIADYKHLWAYTRDIYQLPGVAPTVNFQHIKRHYYMSHKRINPTGIVPVGPVLDFEAPAERGRDVDRLIVF
jgi:putative glutathione S-transferase